MPNALALWRVALYCERCGGVFFAPGAAGVDSAGLMPAAEFQRLVWSAGGYGDLRSARGHVPAPRGLRPASDGSARAS
jgi:hypothetical protein